MPPPITRALKLKTVSSSERSHFQAVLQGAFYLVLKHMCTWNGNVDLTVFDAMMFVAILNDDAT